MGLPESRQLLEKRTEVFEVLLFSVTSAAGVRAKIHSNSAMVEKKKPRQPQKDGCRLQQIRKALFSCRRRKKFTAQTSKDNNNEKINKNQKKKKIK